jgi:hypothetical protein
MAHAVCARITSMADRARLPFHMPGERVRNPRTQARIRQETLWQIGIPLGLVIIAAVALMVWFAVAASVPTRSVFADISLILMLMPCLVAGLIFLAVLVAMNWGLIYALRQLPYLFRQAQDIVVIVGYRVQQALAKISGAVISVRSFIAAAEQTAGNLRSIFTLGRTQ